MFPEMGTIIANQTKLANFDKPFYLSCNHYLYNQSEGLTLQSLTEHIDSAKKKVICYLPCEIDTEFQTYENPKYRHLLDAYNLGSLTITAQLKGVHEPEGHIFAHWDMGRVGKPVRHQQLRSEFAVVDWLHKLGIQASLTQCIGSMGLTYYRAVARKRVLRVMLYAHFAVADLVRVFNGPLKRDILELCRKRVRGSKIAQKRRLKTEYKYSKAKFTQEYIRPQWVITLDGIDYALEISMIDTGAVHGSISLDALATNVGVKLDSKANFTSSEKSLMLDMYYDEFRFDPYALGDLSLYKIVETNSEHFKTIYGTLGVGDYWQPPKLTIGATVQQIFEAKVAQIFSPDKKLDAKELSEILEIATIPGSSNELISHEHTTGGLNAKILGGRCFNNRPLDTNDTGIICDTDISGCYGEGMRIQLYPFGKPVIIEYPKKSVINSYQTLREFLAHYRHELVPGLWQVYFTVKGELPIAQDFFSTYVPPKKWEEIKSDSENIDESWLELPDSNKINTHEITNGLLTHDGLQWLETICSRQLKNFILDNSSIVTAMFYPASERVENSTQFLDKIAEHSKQNTSDAHISPGNTTTVNVERECKTWFSVNLGTLLVDKLLFERKKHPKKTPLNELYKLCTNTTYGDMVSKFFRTSNCCVGNNITARARALAWYMEKGLYMHGSITDGGAFSLNRVAYAKPGKKLNELNSTCTWLMSAKQLDMKHVCFKPLGGYDKIYWYEDTEEIVFEKAGICEKLTPLKALERIDYLIGEHLRNQFKNVDVLWQETTALNIFQENNEWKLSYIPRIGQFGFETKGCVKQATFHGQSNYRFMGGFHSGYKASKNLVAMRSYEKTNDGIAEKFLSSLNTNPTELERQQHFIKPQFVKVGDYEQRYNSYYEDHVFNPGDTILIAGLLREFSLSQFPFRTQSQRESWENHIERMKKHSGQSLEAYFIDNKTGKLNYQTMLETIAKAINEGAVTFRDWIDKYYNRKVDNHPSWKQYLITKNELLCLGVMNPEVENSVDDWDDEPLESVVFEEELDW